MASAAGAVAAAGLANFIRSADAAAPLTPEQAKSPHRLPARDDPVYEVLRDLFGEVRAKTARFE